MLRPLLRSHLRPVLRGIRELGASAFSPRRLFNASEPGVWYDASDLTTMFQDSAGTTAAALESPVGLWLDKSRGLVLGSELVTNGGFDTDTAWTKAAGVTISGGKSNFAAASGYVLYRGTNAGVAPGGLYEVTFTVSDYVSGSIRVYLGSTPTFGVAVSANGTYTARFGPAAGSEIGFNSASAFTGSIDNVSVKALTGSHASQSTSASRPVLRSSGFQHNDFDGVDDNITVASQGAATTAFLLCAAVKVDGGAGANRVIWSDTGTNTGYRVRINTSNQLEISAGNGAAYTTIATVATLPVGETHVVTAWDDGTNLNVQIDAGAVASTARPTVSAGTAGFTIGKDNGAASGYFNGPIGTIVYVKNDAKTAQREQLQRYVAQTAGVSL